MEVRLAMITKPSEAEELRLLRNECASFMTGSTEPISEEQQHRFFWEKLLPKVVDGYLLYEGDVPVAYSLLFPDQNHDSQGWLSAGVTESARGKGYGSIVIEAVTCRGLDRFGRVLGEARADNIASIRTCSKAGYRVVTTYEKNNVLMVLLEIP